MTARARAALPAAVAVALVISAALLLVGVILESAGAAPVRGAAASRPASAGPLATAAAPAPTSHNEAGEQGEAPVRARPPGSGAAAPEQPGEVGHSDAAGTVDGDNGQGETVWGIPIESPVPVGAFVVVSLLLAVVVWRRPTRPVATVVILVVAAAVVLDVAEVLHQLAATRTGLAVLAVVVGGLHLAVIAGAGRMWTGAEPARPDAAVANRL